MSRLHSLLKKKKKKPDKCGFCHAVIAKDETHSGVFYTVPVDGEGSASHDEGGTSNSTIHQVGKAVRSEQAAAAVRQYCSACCS